MWAKGLPQLWLGERKERREGGLLSWGSFSVVVFVQTHNPLLILNTESEKIKTAVEKFPLGYLFLPCKTITTTKISVSKQTN